MFSSNNSQVSNDAVFVEDIFSTYLYTGTGAAQTITNGIDLSKNGGLVWIKRRDASGDNSLTVTGNGFNLSSNLTTDFINEGEPLFNNSGFNLLYGTSYINASGGTYASWTFRKQKKFFDIVTYTGNGANRTIAHNLGSEPACIIIKSTNRNSTDWAVYHRSLGNTQYIRLNNIGAAATSSTYWNNTTPTSTVFSLGTNADVNNSGGANYVAYLFAHDAGGFGLTGTDNVISCGSYTGTGSSVGPTVDLGYEPQWLLVKKSSGAQDWFVFDNMRGVATGGNDYYLRPNSSDAETTGGDTLDFTATGFIPKGSFDLNTSGTYIYIAIRRGPMKVPTSGTSVFGITTSAGTSPAYVSSFPVDFAYRKQVTSTSSNYFHTRLQGAKTLYTNSTAAEDDDSNVTWAYQNGMFTTTGANADQYGWLMRRAPSFMDVVCYTGTGTSGQAFNHNLGVAPELMIVKARGNAYQWWVYDKTNGYAGYSVLNTTSAWNANSTVWGGANPTSSVFTVGSQSQVNEGTTAFVAYLFATCAGVSKVFNYTGNGSSQTINCGFTGGARFVLIKRTDSTGDWYVWDSARGIVSGNDPHLSLNSTAAEVTTDDTIDTDSTGFVVNQVSATNVNVSSATYIGIAIA